MAATSVEGLQAALCNDAVVEVTDNITETDSVLSISNNCVATLDLNGKEVRVQRVVLGGNADLTIMDGVGGGSLIADGSGNANTAGIQTTGATLQIEGGTVEATGGANAAGIGGGLSANGGTVTIEGGTVTATGGSLSAGIGGGRNGNGGTVTISDGTVDAVGRDRAAGIGGGNRGNGGTVEISGGTVTATGKGWGAGIGGGNGGNGGTVTISGGVVTATGDGPFAAGIGGGREGAGGDVAISGGEVTATGGTDAAGIGGGEQGAGGTVTISGGTVTATAGSDTAQPIGPGKGGTAGTVEVGESANDSTTGLVRSISFPMTLAGLQSDLCAGGGAVVEVTDNITETDSVLSISNNCVATLDLNGKEVRVQRVVLGGNADLTIKDSVGGGKLIADARGNDDTAGIQTTGATLQIEGGTVEATGGANAAGIGGGLSANGGTVTIEGGTVTATGGSQGAGIGGGNGGNGGTVTISGGVVTATGDGPFAAGIGGGREGAGGDVAISGGEVTATGGTDAAGIGGGEQGAGGTVTISGGTVTATAGSDTAQPIGPGKGGTAGTVEVGESANDSTTGLVRSISFRVPTIDAGGGESATVGTAVATPPSVLVEDENGPVEGVTVSFTGDGTVAPASVDTDEFGIAAATSWTLGTTAGPQTLTATVGALSVTFEATGVAGDPTQLTIKAGDDQSAEIGSAVETPPSVLVRDEYGNPLEGVTVAFTGDGTFAPATVDTDASGIASVESWTLGTTPGPQTLTATVGALSVTFEATGRITPTLSVTNPGIKTPFTADFTLEVERVLPWPGLPEGKPTDPALEFAVTAGAEHCSVDAEGLVSTTGKTTGECAITVTSVETGQYAEVVAEVSFEIKHPAVVQGFLSGKEPVFGEEDSLLIAMNQPRLQAARSCGVGENVGLMDLGDTSPQLTFVGLSFNKAGECQVEFTIQGVDSKDFLFTYTFTVAKAAHTIVVDTPAPTGDDALTGMTYTPTASSTRDHDDEPTGLTIPLGIATGSTAVCEMDGDGVVTFLQAGECVITADKDETDNYQAASATQTVVVTAPAPAPQNRASGPSSRTERSADVAVEEPQADQLQTPGPDAMPRVEPPPAAGSPEVADEGPATTDDAIGVAPGGLAPPGDQSDDDGGSLTPAPATEASRDVWEGSVILGFGIVSVALLLGLGLLSLGAMGVFSGAGGSSRFSLPTAR